jgi:hypothetical protein
MTPEEAVEAIRKDWLTRQGLREPPKADSEKSKARATG